MRFVFVLFHRDWLYFIVEPKEKRVCVCWRKVTTKVHYEWRNIDTSVTCSSILFEIDIDKRT